MNKETSRDELMRNKEHPCGAGYHPKSLIPKHIQVHLGPGGGVSN